MFITVYAMQIVIYHIYLSIYLSIYHLSISSKERIQSFFHLKDEKTEAQKG